MQSSIVRAVVLAKKLMFDKTYKNLFKYFIYLLRPLTLALEFFYLQISQQRTMPSLKKLTKELRQEIVSYLFPFPPISKDLAFRLAVLIFAKTRFCSHIHFIGRCLHSKVIPKGFRSNFHTSSFSHSNQYRHQIQCAQNSFSRNIMRITIRALCQKRNKLNEQILHWLTIYESLFSLLPK